MNFLSLRFPLATVLRWFSLPGAWLLILLTTGANHRQIFTPEGICFVDADCYARLTRVRAVCEHPLTVLCEHRFENYPFGVVPHTTVPFDYAVAALRLAFLPFTNADRALDLAGVWISPLLGCLTILVVWAWAERARLPARTFIVGLLALSPIVAHGFELGRPDHQSLILLCMAVALCAEWRLWTLAAAAPPRLLAGGERSPADVAGLSDIPRSQSTGAAPPLSAALVRSTTPNPGFAAFPFAFAPGSSFAFWSLVSGGAWALGLWTSLYEPGILFVLIGLAALVWNRPVLWRRDRLPGWMLLGVVLALALWIEGWRVSAPPGFGENNAAAYFAAWTHQIGELASLPPWSPTLYAWSGFGLLAAPALLWLVRGPLRPLARANVGLLLAAFALTCWQVRWGYFLPLVYALSLPWQVAGLRTLCERLRARRSIPAPSRHSSAAAAPTSLFPPPLPPAYALCAALCFVLGLAPLASEWWTHLHPPAALAENLAEQRADAARLREVAAFIRQASVPLPAAKRLPAGFDHRGILAPWWLSPALAYWSGEPALAGSSHESLPGTVDVDRFYTGADWRADAELLRRRRVRWVVAYEPDRVLRTAAGLLGLTQVARRVPGLVLYERPDLAPTYLRLAMVNPYFKIYEVRVGSLPP